MVQEAGGLFVQRSQAICAILVESIMRNISVKQYLICTSGSGGNVVKGGSFVQQTGTTFAILMGVFRTVP